MASAEEEASFSSGGLGNSIELNFGGIMTGVMPRGEVPSPRTSKLGENPRPWLRLATTRSGLWMPTWGCPLLAGRS